jgi:hypothetical protein
LARLELRAAGGALEVEADGEREGAAAAELVLATCAGEIAREPRRIELLGTPAYLKASRLTGRARLRWGAKSVFGIALPRIAEYRNLRWLRARLFAAPRPIAAGVLRSSGLPALQFLLTEEVAPATTLERFLREERGSMRGAVLDELAREVARMHALRFVHHDLYPRNVLVVPPGGLSRLVFLDAWAGGAGWNTRGPAYDLGCLLLRADEELFPEEPRHLFARYVEEREGQGRPVRDPQRFFAAVVRERRARIARLVRRPHELRGAPLPALELSTRLSR